MYNMNLFAATEAPVESGGLLGSLGIDWQLLIIQTVAFLVLLFVLSKFVYPVLASMLERREETIKRGIEAAKESEKRAEEAQAETAEVLENARRQATKIMASAKNEAASVIEAASLSAADRTERMIAKANNDIEKQVESARKELRDETIGLVALATEKVIGSTVTEKVDQNVIKSALRDAKAK